MMSATYSNLWSRLACLATRSLLGSSSLQTKKQQQRKKTDRKMCWDIILWCLMHVLCSKYNVHTCLRNSSACLSLPLLLVSAARAGAWSAATLTALSTLRRVSGLKSSKFMTEWVDDGAFRLRAAATPEWRIQVKHWNSMNPDLPFDRLSSWRCSSVESKWRNKSAKINAVHKFDFSSTWTGRLFRIAVNIRRSGRSCDIN